MTKILRKSYSLLYSFSIQCLLSTIFRVLEFASSYSYKSNTMGSYSCATRPQNHFVRWVLRYICLRSLVYNRIVAFYPTAVKELTYITVTTGRHARSFCQKQLFIADSRTDIMENLVEDTFGYENCRYQSVSYPEYVIFCDLREHDFVTSLDSVFKISICCLSNIALKPKIKIGSFSKQNSFGTVLSNLFIFKNVIEVFDHF